MKLPKSLSLPAQPFETPTGYCSRVSFKLGRSARDFALDCGTTFQGIVDGDPASIATLCSACGIDQTAFAASTIRRLGDRVFSLGQETITRDALCRAEVRVCPDCIAEDLAGPEGDFGAYQRVEWLVEAIRVCPRHNRPLVAVVKDLTPSRIHDFGWHLHPHLKEIGEMNSVSNSVEPGGLTHYLMQRIRGLVPDHWLSKMQLYAAAKSAEIIGVTAVHGAHRSWGALSNSEWLAAGKAGFAIFSDGEASLRSLFADLQRAYKGKKWGLRATFGRIYEFLAHDTRDKGYDPLRDVLREHILDTMPVEVGEVVLGEPVTKRRLHSIRSAAIETGLHPKRLRKQLLTAGVISAESTSLANDKVVFDAESSLLALRRLETAMSLKEAGRYLNIPRPHDRSILTAGFVEPVVNIGRYNLGMHAFARADLDEFLDRLRRNASPVRGDEDGFCWIGAAAKRTCKPSTDIVPLLLAGTLTRVRIDPNERGFKGVLVDPEEVKRSLYPERATLSLREVERRLNTSTGVVVALIEAKVLPCRIEINPMSHQTTRVVEPDALEQFVSEYVSLQNLSHELGRHFRKLKMQIDDLGIKTAFDPERFRATFYRRSDIGTVREKLLLKN